MSTDPNMPAPLFGLGRVMRLLGPLDPASALDLAALRRLLLHSAVVGLGAGLLGAFFFAALDLVTGFMLEGLAGYTPLRAFGEQIGHHTEMPDFRPWLLVFLPAIGGLLSGLITQFFAPEIKGGGADAMIEAFHHHGGVIRGRVIWAKTLASICTLGFGGSGGREGPTMHIGGAIGSLTARLLRTNSRERRILLVAGAAAGIAAVFRTPLGAALLAVEVLYEEGFESDALIPSVLASVVAYSVVTSIFGETTLFSHSNRYPFVPIHLPLYGLLALFVALLATAFVELLHSVRREVSRLPVPLWARPAIGGLALGVFCTTAVVLLGMRMGTSGNGLGLLGGGYGAAQIAISGSPLIGEGWDAVQMLVVLCGAKLVASSLTIGSGGSAGDFAPSLALGALAGGAFGRAAQLIFEDPRLDPGAFALVGMGAFYGGIAHVPLAALVLVCEMARSYDLLVPLMLAEGVAYVVLRKRSLYPAQLKAAAESPAKRRQIVAGLMSSVLVRDLMGPPVGYVCFATDTRADEMLRLIAAADPRQDVFPVLDKQGAVVGLVPSDALRSIANNTKVQQWTLAKDLMQRPTSVGPDDDVGTASSAMLKNELRELPVLDAGEIVGFIDQADIARAYLTAGSTERPGETGDITMPPI